MPLFPRSPLALSLIDFSGELDWFCSWLLCYGECWNSGGGWKDQVLIYSESLVFCNRNDGRWPNCLWLGNCEANLYTGDMQMSFVEIPIKTDLGEQITYYLRLQLNIFEVRWSPSSKIYFLKCCTSLTSQCYLKLKLLMLITISREQGRTKTYVRKSDV